MRELLLRFGIAFALTIVLAISFGYIALTIQSETIRDFDHTVIAFVQGLETPWITTFMKTMSWIGSATFVIPVTLISLVLLYFVWKRRAQAWLLFFVVTGTVVLNALLKVFFQRERPEIYRLIETTGFSFPSGHTMTAFSLYVILVFIIWRTIRNKMGTILVVLFAAFMMSSIALSRIYLGVHFPSDIVGGFLASGLWLTISIGTYLAILRRHEKKSQLFPK